MPLLQQQEAQRLPWLVPVRNSRMVQIACALFRGAAAVTVDDLARQPHSGLMVHLRGASPPITFRFYAPPAHMLRFSINSLK